MSPHRKLETLALFMGASIIGQRTGNPLGLTTEIVARAQADAQQAVAKLEAMEPPEEKRPFTQQEHSPTGGSAGGPAEFKGGEGS